MVAARFWMCGSQHPAGSWECDVTGDQVWEPPAEAEATEHRSAPPEVYGTRREEGKIQSLVEWGDG